MMAQDEHQPGKTPVSAHPAFPAIVALWFAALLGLGTMVMPAVVLEQVASATGLAAVFPPAEAPLSVAGRMTFAVIAAMLGLVGGLVLARRVAQTQDTARPTRRRTANGRSAAPRPLSVHDDLGEEAIAAPADVQRSPLAGRRRALSVTDETGTNDIPMAAPLPGESEFPELSEIPELPMSAPAVPPHETPADAQVFEASAAPVEVPAYVPELDTRKPRPITAPVVFPPESRASTTPIDGPLDNLGMVQLAERLGRSLQQRQEARAPEPEVQPEAHPEDDPLAFSAPSFDHQEDAVSVPPPVVPDALRAFMDGAPEDLAPPPVEAPVAPKALMPFAFQPFDAEDDEDEELADENYSSLFEMKGAFRVRDEFVPIDEPEAEEDEKAPAEAAIPVAPDPARPFEAPQLLQPAPSTAPARPRMVADAAETERALRSALANLQRMSGAA